jgi:hypothetical protein
LNRNAAELFRQFIYIPVAMLYTISDLLRFESTELAAFFPKVVFTFPVALGCHFRLYLFLLGWTASALRPFAQLDGARFEGVRFPAVAFLAFTQVEYLVARLTHRF